MSYLLYCIAYADRPEPVCADASIMARCAGLGAVAAEQQAEDLAPTVDKLLAYANVIERYDRERSVIPMRFGCVFDDLAQLKKILEDRQREYRELLSQLDGHTEISARICFDISNHGSPAAIQSVAH